MRESLINVSPPVIALFLACALGASALRAEEAPSALAAGEPEQADVQAEHLLKRMANAMQTTNYEGLLLHMRGGEARSMRVFHRYDAQHGEREHLLSLDGKPFEVLHDSSGCTCVWPQSRFMVIGKSPALNGRLSAQRFADTGALAAFYRIARQGQARIGGIACRLVKLEPRDAYRFGYRLCIHEPSALLLNLEVFDGERRLELNQFTQLRVRRDDEVDDMRLFTDVEGFRVVEDKREASAESPKAEFQPTWVARQLPPGYELRSAAMRVPPHFHSPQGKPVEQLIFSDGLGSVSVFIERVDAHAASDGAQGADKPQPHGAMQRVVRKVDGYRLTAVGDAPEAAMRILLDNMQAVQGRAGE
ncbi:MAG: MucB/RseB C-terminal domain-containing protein [Pseudomonadota bacterium]